jgi:hypothetical protein
MTEEGEKHYSTTWQNTRFGEAAGPLLSAFRLEDKALTALSVHNHSEWLVEMHQAHAAMVFRTGLRG